MSEQPNHVAPGPPERTPAWRQEARTGLSIGRGGSRARPAEDAKQPTPPHKRASWWFVLAFWIGATWFVALTVQLTGTTRVSVPYSYFVGQVHAGNVVRVSTQDSAISGTFRHKITYPAGKQGPPAPSSAPAADVRR